MVRLPLVTWMRTMPSVPMYSLPGVKIVCVTPPRMGSQLLVRQAKMLNVPSVLGPATSEGRAVLGAIVGVGASDAAPAAGADWTVLTLRLVMRALGGRSVRKLYTAVPPRRSIQPAPVEP